MLTNEKITPDYFSRCCSFVVLATADILLLSFAVLFSYFMTLDISFTNDIANNSLSCFLTSLAIIPVYILFFFLFNLYRRAWHYASLEIIFSVIVANILAFIWLKVCLLLFGISFVPRAFLAIFFLTSIILIGGFRVLLRLYINLRQQVATIAQEKLVQQKRVLIIGGGAQGVRLLMVLNQEHSRQYQVVGFLDEQPGLHGLFVRNVRVLGPFDHLFSILKQMVIDEVFIALPRHQVKKLREHILACRAQKVPVKIIPDLQDVLMGKAHMLLEEISVEDLLRRPPIKTDLSSVGATIKGKCVLVTGAGGSIGSELCRQILALGPEKLILFGHGENSIDIISRELLDRFPKMKGKITQVIGSVSDEVRVRQTFARYSPQVVFHAAAHKHVPIMQANIAEAVNNNIFGTLYLAKTCGHFGVERMVFISTDKAVYPSSIMGATKWICEEVVRSLTNEFTHTHFVTVRFGNVLGSRGSVVPVFKEQIRNGGPVTITDAEMTRYFMTIPEAVQLVMQAGAQGKSGDLYLLEMGEPVKILDLAQDMIRLSGFIPDVDIPIVFTGLRPGEKLHESLITDDSEVTKSTSEKLALVLRKSQLSAEEIRRILLRLETLVQSGEPQQLLTYLRGVVPTLQVDFTQGQHSTDDVALV